MYQQEVIKLVDHLTFIDTLKKNKQKEYFLVKKQGLPIGVINLNYEKELANFGLYKNPEVKKKGIGYILIKYIIYYAFNKKKNPYIATRSF